MKVCAVQFGALWGDTAGSVVKMRRLLGGVAEETRLVVLPEMWSCGSDNDRLDEHAAESPAALDALCAFARDRLCWVVAGSMPWRTEGGVANRAWVIDDGGRPVGFYDKTHLITVAPFEEHRYLCPGGEPCFFQVDGVRFGVAICYDIRFPEYVRALALAGIHALVVPAEWPSSREQHWRALLTARAIENQMYVLACNQCGVGGGTRWGGASLLLGPDGSVLADAGDEERCIAGEVSKGEAEKLRKNFPVFRDRRKELYAAVTEF